PTAYALNRAMPDREVAQFQSVAETAKQSLSALALDAPAASDFREGVARYVRSRDLAPDTMPSLLSLVDAITQDTVRYGSLGGVPAEAVNNVRNDMYLASEAIRLALATGKPPLDAGTAANLVAFRGELDRATKFIPLWVKVAVAIALGLGTMVGWRRVVVTVGEKIGKSHMTYAQGGAAEVVAMSTIAAADAYGLPVS